MANFTLSRNQTVLLIIDMQDKMFAAVDRGHEVLQTILKVVKGFHVLKLPVLLSEQYPQGLGETVLPLKTLLGQEYQPRVKTTFSCVADPAFSEYVKDTSFEQWVLVGIEAHVCVLQTAKDLLNKGKQVTVLNDAITSRSIYDYSTAIAEMRDAGVRISGSETILFELVHDSKNAEFKQISQLVKSRSEC